MTKIGILTRRAAYNFGSTLQAYAMTRFINNEGYPNIIFDYDEYAHNIRWRIRPAVEDIMYTVFRICPPLFKLICPKKQEYLKIRHLQKKKFGEFEKDFLSLTSKKYKSSAQLKKDYREYEVLVCGSDQIWSPILYDPVFLFDFVEPQVGVNTVAYAPSIGVGEKELIGEEARTLIKQIKYISCREEAGAKILSEITEKKVEWVLDPTLMVPVSDWNKVCTTESFNDEEPYILCYFLGNENIPIDYISRLKKKLGINVLNVQTHLWLNRMNADKQMYDIGPREFLNLVKNASWVCTDSFHCVIFSFLFERRFSVFERFKSTDLKNQNSRIYSLLKILKLEELLTTNQDMPSDKNVDYSRSRIELQKWQDKSRKYLIESISK